MKCLRCGEALNIKGRPDIVECTECKTYHCGRCRKLTKDCNLSCDLDKSLSLTADDTHCGYCGAMLPALDKSGSAIDCSQCGWTHCARCGNWELEVNSDGGTFCHRCDNDVNGV